MPRTYDAEFRRRVVELVRVGRPVRGPPPSRAGRGDRVPVEGPGPHRPWVKPGLSTGERGELAATRQRIKELETELALVKQAAKLFGEGCAQKPPTRSSLS